MSVKKFSFLGFGNMAKAIFEGMKETEYEICLFDKDISKYGVTAPEGCKIAPSASEAVEFADYVIFAVKPQNFVEVCSWITQGGTCLDGKVFVSIAAGVSTGYICELLKCDVPVIRCMPNTPMLVGSGATALCRNALVSDEAFGEIIKLFSRCGTAFPLDESQMNTIISATSSAPAYVFLFIKAIADSAAAQGICVPDLLDIIAAMVSGSADMIRKTGSSPEELIRMVCSPGGTTERAMKVLQEKGFADIIHEAMLACTKRADELSGAK